jgi:hypothetical protein
MRMRDVVLRRGLGFVGVWMGRGRMEVLFCLALFEEGYEVVRLGLLDCISDCRDGFE